MEHLTKIRDRHLPPKTHAGEMRVFQLLLLVLQQIISPNIHNKQPELFGASATEMLASCNTQTYLKCCLISFVHLVKTQ